MVEVAAVGSAVLDRGYGLTNLPEPDGGAFVRDRYEAVGGVPANVASALSRFGREAGVVARLGEDAAADTVLADLRERGIDASRVRRGSGETSYCLVLRDPDGERMIIAGGESVQRLRLGDTDHDYCEDADVTFTSAYAPDSVVRDLRDSGARLAFDLAGPFSELEGRGVTRETVDSLLSDVALFVTNAVAARSYFGCGPSEAARELADRGVERGVVTRGTAGSLLVAGGEVIEVPAFDVDTVDTTGAGDAFTAGLVDAWLLDERPAREAGRWAAAAAALNCRARGAKTGLPDRDAVEGFLDLR